MVLAVEDIRLFHKNFQVENYKSLSDYQVKENDIFYQWGRIKGGGHFSIVPLEFNSLTSMKSTLTDKTPVTDKDRHLIIKKGLNMEGVCNN